MSKHSPGPWHWEEGMLKAPDGSPVAGVSTYPRPVDGRLIAAAPEMLELLRETVTEGYLAELIAHRTVSGLRCQEEQRCFAAVQALLRRIDG